MLHDPKQLVQHPTNISDCLGGTPSILNPSLTSNASAFPFELFSPLAPDYDLVSLSCPVAPVLCWEPPLPSARVHLALCLCCMEGFYADDYCALFNVFHQMTNLQELNYSSWDITECLTSILSIFSDWGRTILVLFSILHTKGWP